MDELELVKCPFCNETFSDRNVHNDGLKHRYNFKIFGYNKYRKRLINNRHGIELEVTDEVYNNFRFNFTYLKNRGKYIVKVTPEQLLLHDNTISFKCTLKNTRKDDIYVTNINLLHFSTYFNIIHQQDFFIETEDTFHKIPSRGQYTFQIKFSTLSSSSSYKIPLACDFQTLDRKCFTVVRTFLVCVDEANEDKTEKVKSPFTSQPWRDMIRYISTTEGQGYDDRYPIPKEYKRVLNHNLQQFSTMSYQENQIIRRLTQLLGRLTIENYKDFWHTLLWLEESAQAVMLTRYNMEGVTMDIINDDTLVLEVPGLAEKRPSVVIGDYILIRVQGDHTAYKGFVKKVNDKTIEIAYVDEELLDVVRLDSESRLDVSFQVGRLCFERSHHAVEKIVDTGVVKTLFPATINASRGYNGPKLEDSGFYNQKIVKNHEQKTAVIKICNNIQTIPYIVFGPPGTGKTVTIIEAILQLKKHTKKRILICAPANSACDLIAQKLIPYCKKSELIRIHSRNRETITLTDELKTYSNIDEDNEILKVEMSELLSYRIVITTLVLIGKFKNEYQPDCVFIDEAAQANEPETDIALSFMQLGKLVVLAGDPMQLGPGVTDSTAKFGLGISLLERLMKYKVYMPNSATGKYNTNFITMLKQNFRSHPLILAIPNEKFYEYKLQPVSTVAVNDPIVNIPVYPYMQQRNNVNGKKKTDKKITGQAIEFYSLSSKEKREGSSPSFFNLLEAKTVVKCVKALVNLNLGADYKVKLDHIGVVTPYKRQVHKILEGLKHNGFEGVEVGTTESFQGREKRIIIISTVRAQHALLLHDKKYNLGFVKHDKRFNVALTRAVSKLIVIGCPLVLMKDEKWENYIRMCKAKQSYFGDHFDFNQERFQTDVVIRMKRFVQHDDQFGGRNN